MAAVPRDGLFLAGLAATFSNQFNSRCGSVGLSIRADSWSVLLRSRLLCDRLLPPLSSLPLPFSLPSFSSALLSVASGNEVRPPWSPDQPGASRRDCLLVPGVQTRRARPPAVPRPRAQCPQFSNVIERYQSVLWPFLLGGRRPRGLWAALRGSVRESWVVGPGTWTFAFSHGGRLPGLCFAAWTELWCYLLCPSISSPVVGSTGRGRGGGGPPEGPEAACPGRGRLSAGPGSLVAYLGCPVRPRWSGGARTRTLPVLEVSPTTQPWARGQERGGQGSLNAGAFTRALTSSRRLVASSRAGRHPTRLAGGV